MKSKKFNNEILIVNQYASLFHENNSSRHLRLKKILEEGGWRVTIVACYHSHLSQDRLEFNKLVKPKNNQIKFVAGFSSSRNFFIRFLNTLIFSIKILFLPVRRKTLIWGSSPDPVVAFSAFILSKIKKCIFIYEVRDVWPDSIVEINGFSPFHPYVFLCNFIENLLLKKCDVVVSTLKNYDIRLDQNEIQKKFIYVPNFMLFAEVEKHFSLISSETKVRLIYSGSIGLANSLDVLIEGVILAKSEYDIDISLDIYGDGPELPSLKNRYALIDHINFLGVLQKSKLRNIYKNYDLGVISWLDKPVYRYGISPSKIPDYLSMGLPILMAFRGSHPIRDYQAGFLCDPQSPLEIAILLCKYKHLSNYEKNVLRSNAIRCTKEQFTERFFKKRLYKELSKLNEARNLNLNF